MRVVDLVTESARQTERIARSLADGLQAGDLVLIAGDVGTGKTTFVRAACRGLGVAENVTSPSFVIGRIYAGRLPVSHLDLFRLESLDDEDPALLADYLDPGSVAFVEWPGGAGPAFENQRVALRLRLSHGGGDRRLIEVTGREDLLARIETGTDPQGDHF